MYHFFLFVKESLIINWGFLFNEINILPTYSPISPTDIRITPENIVTATNIAAEPVGKVLLMNLFIIKIIARIKPAKDKIEPINNDNLNGKIEKLVDIFDQSCNIFINVYPDLPCIRWLCSALITPILFVIPNIIPSIYVNGDWYFIISV